MRISPSLRQYLRCPRCKSPLRQSGAEFLCETCGIGYPVLSGIPIVIDESASTFRISSYIMPKERTHRERVKRLARAALPTISMNVAARRNFRRFRELLFELSPEPRVLVIGGAIAGAGMGELLSDERIDFVESDVSIDDRTTLVCDAHNLPFSDQTFDGVIIQAVLLYLPEFQHCIAEIYRVLKPQGVLYSEAAFMEQVVGGEFDFYRFTLKGHEYQFRKFEKIASGISGGPAMATAWSVQYLLLSFTESALLRAAIKIFCKCTLFWLKYVDLLLVRKRGAVDAAAGTYFLGRRREQTATYPLAIPQYTGLIPTDVRAWR